VATAGTAESRLRRYSPQIDSTRSEYGKRVNRVIDHIRERLRAFHRLLRARYGETEARSLA
jgi:hypothetical protein